MASSVSSPIPPTMAATFRRLGWLGLGVQLALGVLPLGMYGLGLLAARGGLGFGGLLILPAAAGLLASLFRSYRCVQLGNSIRRSKHLSRATVMRSLWVGATVNLVVMGLGVMVAMATLGALLGAMIGWPGVAIATLDLVGLQAMISAVAAGLVGVIITLLLLRRLG